MNFFISDTIQTEDVSKMIENKSEKKIKTLKFFQITLRFIMFIINLKDLLVT